jgi:hypothetical protein
MRRGAQAFDADGGNHRAERDGNDDAGARRRINPDGGQERRRTGDMTARERAMTIAAEPFPSGPWPMRRALDQPGAGVGSDWSKRDAGSRPTGCSQHGGSGDALCGRGPRRAKFRHESRGLSGGMATGPPGDDAIESADAEVHE